MITLQHKAPQVSERRRHQRVKVVLLGRYMLADRQEYPCQSIDISPGGVALVAPVLGQPEERVVCYLDSIGRLEGQIARTFEIGFALSFNVPIPKREKLAEQLTWLANRHELGMVEDRRHERITPRLRHAIVTLADRTQCDVQIIDVSQSGCAIATDLMLPLGMGITIGRTLGRVVRVFPHGFGIEFVRPIPTESFTTSIVL